MGEEIKRALIIGGAGPVGSALAASLLTDGWAVRCVDNELFTATNTHRINLLNPNFEHLSQDVANLKSEDFLDLGERISIIYNFCGPARYSFYRSNPMLTASTQVAATMLSIDIALKHQCRLVFASSSEVYGSGVSRSEGMREDQALLFPFSTKRSVYSGAKFTCERVVQDVAGLDAMVIRLFNVYGTNSAKDDDRVIPLFLRLLQEGRPLPLDGDGSQIRSFIFIDDAIDIVRKVSESPSTEYGLYNVGNPEPVSVRQLIEVMEGVSGLSCAVKMRDVDPDDVRVRIPNIERVASEFQWWPKVSLREGLAECLKKTV